MGLCPERRRCGGNIAVGATHGKCQPMDKNRGAVGGWGIRWLCLSLSMGYLWVVPVIRGLRLSALPTAVFLSPRCGSYQGVSRCAFVSLRALTRNLILTLSNATRPRPYQLHGIWGLSLLIYEMDVSSVRDARLVRPHDG